MKAKSAHRPPAKEMARLFREKVGCEVPPASAIYHTDTKSPLRPIAEYEDMGGVLIAYPGTISQPRNQIQLPPTGPRMFGIPNELIVRMQQRDKSRDEAVHIFIMCADSKERAAIISDLTATAADMNLKFDSTLIHLIPWDTDSYWTRDYGPWWVYNSTTGYYGIAKHLYTSLGGGSVGLVEGAESVTPRQGAGIFRPNDDYGADLLSDFLNAPIRMWNRARWGTKTGSEQTHLEPIKVHNWYNTGLLDVGGNYMVTRKGTIASSYLVATQNELPVHDEGQTTDPSADTIKKRMEYILEQLNRFMGVNKYHVLTDPSGTYIGHIDCWGKFLSDDDVLIAQSDDEQTNRAFDGIAQSFSDDGFNVHRVLCQDMYVPVSDEPNTTAAYTNSLILNDHVYVPLAGGNYNQHDTAALAVYQQALPKHKIIGIIGKPEAPWLGTDAMHCRTRGIPRAVVKNWLKSLSQPLVGE